MNLRWLKSCNPWSEFVVTPDGYTLPTFAFITISGVVLSLISIVIIGSNS